jgi:hypothetical protein
MLVHLLAGTFKGNDLVLGLQECGSPSYMHRDGALATDMEAGANELLDRRTEIRANL